MVFSTTIFNLLTRTLATILYTPPTRLISQNSSMSTALGFFGIREMKVTLKPFTNIPLAGKSWETFMMFALTI
jgi:hypothetical protein